MVGDPGMVRTERYRRHKENDHSLCRPESCDLAPPPSYLPDPQPSEWGETATLLWGELEPHVPGHYRPLLREACRIVDRLDRLDGILQRKSDWLRINTMDFGENVKVKITMDGVLAESRQQAAVAQALVKDLAQFAPEKAKVEPKAGGLGDLSARIAARRGSSAG